MNYIFDTDVVIDLMRNKTYALSFYSQIEQFYLPLISVLTVAEICSGWSSAQRIKYLPKLYKLFSVVNLDLAIAEKAGEIRKTYAIKGISLGMVDTLIAATSIEKDCVLVTNNIKHFPMPNIKIHKFDN